MASKHLAVVDDGAKRQPASKEKLRIRFQGSLGELKRPIKQHGPVSVFGHRANRRTRARAEFLLALKKWERATARINGQTALTAHPASVKLMNMDRSIEFMVKAVWRQPSVLVFLLQKKTGQRPYDGIEPGDLTAMSQSWAKWYRDKSAK
jgi:hypothetical protein